MSSYFVTENPFRFEAIIDMELYFVMNSKELVFPVPKILTLFLSIDIRCPTVNWSQLYEMCLLEHS